MKPSMLVYDLISVLYSIVSLQAEVSSAAWTVAKVFAPKWQSERQMQMQDIDDLSLPHSNPPKPVIRLLAVKPYPP